MSFIVLFKSFSWWLLHALSKCPYIHQLFIHNSRRNKPVCVMQVYLAALRCVLTVGFLNYITEPEACQVSSFPSTYTHIYIHILRKFTMLFPEFSRTHVTRSLRRVPRLPWKRFSVKKRRKNRRMDKRGENRYQFYFDVSQNS